MINEIYKYFKDATFKIKYLKGAIDESGSIFFNIVSGFYNCSPANSNTAINVVIDDKIVV